MAKFVLTTSTPDYDNPGVYILQNYEFRSIYKLTQYAEECLRRLISFEIDQVVERRYKELCGYNFFDDLGLEFSESCPYYLKYKLSLVSKANGIYSYDEEVKDDL